VSSFLCRTLRISGTYFLALLALLTAVGGCSDGSDTPRSHPATIRNLPITVEQSAGLPDYNIYRPADLFATLSSTAAAIMGNTLVAVADVVGGPEDIAIQYAQQDYDLLPVGVPGFLAKRSEADHRTVSTDRGNLDEVVQVSTNWIDFTLTANSRVRRALVENP
jgi:hypothetical protein